MTVFVPVLGGFTTWTKWCTLLFHNLNKNTETNSFLQESGFCCKATNQFLLLDGENKDNWAYWCFGVRKGFV